MLIFFITSSQFSQTHLKNTDDGFFVVEKTELKKDAFLISAILLSALSISNTPTIEEVFDIDPNGFIDVDDTIEIDDY